jgi:hypothetical protein
MEYKDKVMKTESSQTDPTKAQRKPELIFANWRELLNQLGVAPRVKRIYAVAIEGYLDYCRRNGVSVGIETARECVSNALRRGLISDEEGWKAALNWFFREGCKRAAPQPEGVPSVGHADTGKTPWESRKGVS